MMHITLRIDLLKPKKDKIKSPIPMGTAYITITVNKTKMSLIPLYLEISIKAINVGT
jgi:hypothetical protein